MKCSRKGPESLKVRRIKVMNSTILDKNHLPQGTSQGGEENWQTWNLDKTLK